jgi:predicted RNA-binding protein with PIN domain
MPRRWLIDGMNVIGSRPDKWWKDPPRAMRFLVDSLDHFAHVTDDEMIVVFDQDPEVTRGSANAGVVVASRKGRNAADHEIVDIVRRDEDPSGLLVVTSDKSLKEKVEALGAHVVPSRVFRDRLDAALGGDDCF